jgi:hypothetical protein
MRLLIAILALLASLTAGFLSVRVMRAAAPTQLIEAEVGGTRFAFSPTLARDEETLAGGVVERLAFVAVFPEFAARAAKSPSPGSGPRGRDFVFVTISPKDDGMDPAERPARLYARFLEAEAFVGPGGLVMRRFEKGSPYDLEQLYIAPPEGRQFFARCPQSQQPGEGPQEPCLFLYRTDALDVELRFSPALLEQWEALADGARAFLVRIRRNDRMRR